MMAWSGALIQHSYANLSKFSPVYCSIVYMIFILFNASVSGFHWERKSFLIHAALVKSSIYICCVFKGSPLISRHMY